MHVPTNAFRRPWVAVLMLLATAAPVVSQRAMTPEDLWSMGRVGSPALSPDGQSVVYPVTRYDLGTDRGHTDLWLVPVAGGEPRQLTHAEASSSSPAWSPDGRWIAFVSARNDDGAQVWLMPAAGGEARQLTRLEGGARGPIWSADGSLLAVTSDVWPADDELGDRMRELSNSNSSARIYDELMYRHWDTWEDGMRSHVFAVDPESGEARDLTPGAYDTPPLGLGGFQDYDLSPDGAELAFVRNTDVPTAVGTGNDIWLVATAGGEPRLLTESDGNDVAPQYSPDGRWIAYLAQERPGFEADRKVLVLYDRRSGEHRPLTAGFDRSVQSFEWGPDSRTIWFNAQDELHVRVYRVAVAGRGAGEPVALTDGAYDGAFALAGDGLVVARQEAHMPAELFALDGRGRVERQLTHTNRALLDELALQPVEPFWFTGAEGDRVQGFLVRPPDFDPTKKWPVIFLVHGGPQGAWTDNFHYRWNFNMFAAPGYVVVAINPRGSTGYGQEFTDEITLDWGGRVFTDLMNGLDHALATYDYLDGEKMAAAGASYGGYMMNWFQGHTDRFRTIINHDGLFDLRSMYYATEELWFPEWEFGGPPWEGSEAYDRWNPAAFVEEWDTPMLIIHGEQDFRVPLEQGLAAFTALRRRDIPARLLVFPDEGHFVLRPSNALVWWNTIYDWLDRWLDRAS
ncbi:MAG: prolyl oligopeptidase family serine peptidase [Gemmatimonadota bacterium]